VIFNSPDNDAEVEYIVFSSEQVKSATISSTSKELNGGNMTEEQKAEQQKIIHSGNSEEAYWFTKKVLGADILALQQVMIERGTPKDIQVFISSVSGAAPYEEETLNMGM